MGCKIEPSQDHKYISLVVTGDITGDLMMKYILESHALGHELSINRYLVDVTGSRNVDSPPENFSFARYKLINTAGIDQSARIASLVRPGDKSHDSIETVCRSIGLDLTNFTDRFQALQHLTRN